MIRLTGSIRAPADNVTGAVHDGLRRVILISRRSFCGRKDRLHSHAPTAALGAYKPPVLGDINEDHCRSRTSAPGKSSLPDGSSRDNGPWASSRRPL